MSGILNILAAGKAAGSSFLPSDLTGLIGWYKADTGVTHPSGFVTAVTDQSGTGHNLVNANNVPYNATSAYNSLPAFDFAVGNDAALVTGTNPAAGSVTLAANLTTLSVFFVGRMNTATATFGRGLVIAGGSDPDYNTTNNIVVFVKDTSSGTGIASTYNSVGLLISPLTTGANHRVGVVMNGSTITHYIDGVPTASPPAFTALNIPNTGSVSALTNFIIGNQWSNGIVTGAAWDGPILEIVITTSAISPTNAANLDAYFVARLGS